MKTIQMTSVLVALAVLVLPALSLASTYQYIDINGNVRTVEASSFSVALATAPSIAPHSGVMLVNSNGSTQSPVVNSNTNTGGNLYQYINVNGNVQTVVASSASVALATAPNIAANSGVMLVN